MKLSTTRRNRFLASAILVGSIGSASAQTSKAVQIPIVSAYAGIPAGGSGTACSNDIPTFGTPAAPSLHVGDGCLPSQATLNAPSSTAIDAYGNIYISDYGEKLLRVIYQGGPALTSMLIAANAAVPGLVPVSGHIYTLAGSQPAKLPQTGTPKAYYCNQAATGLIGIASNGDGCPATQGYIQPRGIAIDANGNVFFASLAGAEGMRVIYAGGSQVASLITTLNPTVTSPQVGYLYSITGTSTAGFSGDGGKATTAAFENVRDVTVDRNGNLFITDGNSAASTTNNNIREINGTTGIINTIAGSTTGPKAACPSGGLFGGDGGPAPGAVLNSPYAMFLDSSGNLYFADSCNGRLRVIYAAGTIPGQSNPVAGHIYTVAGGGTLTGGATGVPATQLNIALMQSAGIDAAGNLYVVDNTNRYVWQINPTTDIATLYGGLGLSGTTTVPAPAAGAYCNGTSGLKSIDNSGNGCPALQTAISPSLRYIGDNYGNVYAVESGADMLRQYSLNNIFPATAVGTSTTQPLAFSASAPDNFGLQGSATIEYSDGGGMTCSAVASTPSTNLCIYNIQFSPGQAGERPGSIGLGPNESLGTFLLSGSGVAPQLSIDPGTQTTVGSGLTPQGLASDLLGNLYVSDAKAGQVVSINITSNAVAPVIPSLSNPNQVAIDGAGNLYVADTGNNRILERQAGTGSIISLGSGLDAPQGVAVDGIGNLYVADTGNNRIVELAGSSQITLPSSGLNQPTRVTVDVTGDLFVADQGNSRIVELNSIQGQTVVNVGSAGIKPMGIGVDPAGNLYIADASSLQVLELFAGTSTLNTIASNLKAPSDLAVGPNGSVYVADSQTTGAIAVNRALGAITFPITNVAGGQSTNANIALSNTGNTSLVFSGSPIASPTSPSTIFAIGNSAVNSCSANGSVIPGAECLLTGSFSPKVIGSPSQLFTFSTNAANNSSVQASLSGTGDSLVATSTTVSITSPSTSTIGFGTSVVLNAVVSLSTNQGAPSGSITLSVDGKAQPSMPFGNGTVSITLHPSVGIHIVTAVFDGDSIYASSSSSVSFTVAPASTTTNLTILPASVGGASTVTFTATVSSSTANGETGTVNFYGGTTLLNTVPLSGSTASYTTTNLSFANSSFTAVYSGDSNFASSTSPLTQPAPDFILTTTVSTLATAQGGVANTTVTLTPVFGMTGTVTPSCGTLPANTVCRFQPTMVTLSGSSSVGVSIQVYTNVSSSLASLQNSSSNPLCLAMLGPPGIGLLFSLSRRRGGNRGSRRLLGFLLVLLPLMWGLTGCVQHQVAEITPTGTQNIKVTFTGTGGVAPPTHSVTYSLAINTP
jgi:sugar lactone lactonase YvrE